jgi:hypothetical protein
MIGSMSTIDIDADLTAQAFDLLRTDERLLAAAPLLGKVAVLYREPKPEPEAPPADKPTKGDKKGLRPPPRDGVVSVTFTAESLGKLSDLVGKLRGAEASGEVTAAPPGPPACPSPWHAAAVLSKADALAKFRPDTFTESSEWASLNGGPILAKVIVDGTIWDKLDGAGQRAAMVHALRGLRHKSRASDDADIAVIEKPPIRCWPDTAAESQELMAALGPDGAEGAALTGALASSDLVENLDEAIAKFRRRFDAGQDLALYLADLTSATSRMLALCDDLQEQADPSDNGPSADQEAA